MVSLPFDTTGTYCHWEFLLLRLADLTVYELLDVRKDASKRCLDIGTKENRSQPLLGESEFDIPSTYLEKWIRPFFITGFRLSSLRLEPLKASAGTETMYSLFVLSFSLNWGLIAYSQLSFMISLIPVWLSLFHDRPNLVLQILSKASSMKMPPQRPPTQHKFQISLHHGFENEY